ncbi:porin [Kaistia algarum]|uniref:porin n=1 Tax=Kaistia algarum TaxID=2083279 RepID=UPI000CE7F646|nr:porin [Kaistia algarum]MCX5514704.1 porin [Kaistia algarum]PPE78870.1 porin [Kaistia algarum]
MNFKTLLLGSAAAMVVAGGAHAADLTVAEPVDYVKVCDAFGKGFYYSPGTDTCIKVGGYVKFGTSVGDTDFTNYNSTYPDSNWSNFYTEVSIQLTASSVTEFGNLTGFLEMRAQTGNTGGFNTSLTQAVNATTKSAYMQTAYLSLGPVKAGYFDSLFDFGQGYNDTGGFSSDTKTDQIMLNYTVNGFGLALAVEDQRDRGSAGNLGGLTASTAVTYGYDSGTGQYYPILKTTYAEGGSDNIPNVIGAISYASGIVSAKLAAAYTDIALDRTGTGTASNPYVFSAQQGWAVGGSIELALDAFSAGDKFQIYGAYGDNANSFTGIAGGTSVAGLSSYTSQANAAMAQGTSWSAFASYKHVFTPAVYMAATASYAEYDGDGYYRGGDALQAWRGVLGAGWTPVKGLDVLAEGSYNSVTGEGSIKDGDAWSGVLWLKRSW